MPSQQTEQLVQLAQAPVNNLIVVLAIFLAVIVIGTIVLVWRFGPVVLKQIQQQLDTNAKLTEIAGQNASQVKLTQQSVDKNTSEIIKQTGILSEQNALLTDFKNYQKLNNDQVADLTTHVDKNSEKIDDLRKSIERLNTQIDNLIQNHSDCSDLKHEWEQFKQQVLERLQAPTNAVAVNVLPNANTIPDDDVDAGAKGQVA